MSKDHRDYIPFCSDHASKDAHLLFDITNTPLYSDHHHETLPDTNVAAGSEKVTGKSSLPATDAMLASKQAVIKTQNLPIRFQRQDRND